MLILTCLSLLVFGGGCYANENGNVAFSAGLWTTTILGRFQTIIFDHVITNIGLGYDRATGIFTCVEAGTYQFSATIVGVGRQKLEAQLVVGGMWMMYVVTNSFEERMSGSSSVVVACPKGQKVWMRIHSYSGRGYAFVTHASMFSGYKLFNDLN